MYFIGWKNKIRQNFQFAIWKKNSIRKLGDKIKFYFRRFHALFVADNKLIFFKEYHVLLLKSRQLTYWEDCDDNDGDFGSSVGADRLGHKGSTHSLQAAPSLLTNDSGGQVTFI